jgi:hypothetical protein
MAAIASMATIVIATMTAMAPREFRNGVIKG